MENKTQDKSGPSSRGFGEVNGLCASHYGKGECIVRKLLKEDDTMQCERGPWCEIINENNHDALDTTLTIPDHGSKEPNESCDEKETEGKTSDDIAIEISMENVKPRYNSHGKPDANSKEIKRKQNNGKRASKMISAKGGYIAWREED